MSHFSRPLGFLGALFFAAALSAPGSADACGGGGFFQDVGVSTQTAKVDGHRVVISLSKTQTVLWDQIRFSGAPEDFAWIYPIKPGAKLELASDAWTDTLDAATTKILQSPSITCYEEGGGSSGGTSFGCGSAGDAQSGGDRSYGGDKNGSVTVVHKETVGPYDTTTVSSAEPGAIGTWLTANGYKVPADAQPILDSYAQDGFDFIAMRLTPGAGVAQMKPVRVVSPGPITTFPMRMLAVGAADKVALSVLILSEGRVEVDGYTNVAVNPAQLVWDFEAGSSNYAELHDKALATDGGAAFLTSYAAKGELLGQWENENDAASDNITGLFFKSGIASGEAKSCDPGKLFGSPYGDVSTAESGYPVVDLCDDAGACAEPGKTETDSRTFECGELDDLAIALTGMHPRDVWLTRLEANLPKQALSKDLVLVPLGGEDEVGSVVQVQDYINEPCNTSAAPLVTKSSRGGQQSPPRGGLVLFGIGAALALAIARRLRPAARVRA